MVDVMTSDEMFHKAQNANDAAIALLSKPDFSSDDKAEYERLKAVADDFYSRSKVRRDLEAQKAREMADFANRPDKKTDSNDDSGDDDKQNSQNDDSLGGFKSIGHWFKAVWSVHKHKNPDNRLVYYGGGENHKPRPMESMKALAENVGATGGFLVQPEFERRVRAVQQTMSLMRPGAEIIRMNARTVTLPVLDQTGATAGQGAWFGGMVAYWTEENAQMTESEPNFRQETLTAHNMTVYTRTSQQVLDDSASAIEDFFLGQRGFPGVMTWTEDYAFLQGDGVGKPEGILNSDGRLTVGRTAGSDVQYDDLVKMMVRMIPSSQAIWIAHQSVKEKLLLMNAPSGNPSFLWGSAAAGVPDTLLGRPIVFTDKLPYLGTTGDIIFVDRSFYMIGDRQTITIDVSIDEYFRLNQVSWRANHRVDGKSWLSSPITYQDAVFQVSPFVVLTDVGS